MEQSRIDLAQTLTISEGESRKATSFAARRMTWARFVARLRTPVRTAETCAQYAAMSRAERAEIKDVGGFVGGRLEGGSRKAGSVTERQLLCLDIDYGDETIWDSWACLIGCAAVMHSTHSHTADRPRLRRQSQELENWNLYGMDGGFIEKLYRVFISAAFVGCQTRCRYRAINM